MSVYDAERPRLARMWDRLDARLARLPPQLAVLGKQFRASIRADDRAYFSSPDAAPLLFLPIWLARADDDALDDILEASALAYWYVRIQDNVIDEPAERGHSPYLLLANIFIWDALELWRKRISSERFWALSRAAWTRFSDETEGERACIAGRSAYSESAFVRHAGKVALAEIPIFAVMAVSDDWRGADCVPPLVHALGQAYGRLNDVLGHERDLRTNGHTYLLAKAAEVAGSTQIDAMRKALIESELLETFLDGAVENHREAAVCAEKIGISQMQAFTAERLARLATMRLQISLLRLGSLTAPSGSTGAG